MMHNMITQKSLARKAEAKDAEKISRLANSLKLGQENLTRGGFLVYPLTSEEYQQRILISPYFYAAEEDTELRGFLMCYNDITLESMIKQSLLSHEENLVSYARSQRKPFVFGDQIAITQESQHKGLGKRMLAVLFSDMKAAEINDLYVGVLYEPVMNAYSAQFCNHLGFSEIGSVRNADKTLWGVYHLKI